MKRLARQTHLLDYVEVMSSLHPTLASVIAAVHAARGDDHAPFAPAIQNTMKRAAREAGVAQGDAEASIYRQEARLLKRSPIRAVA
jgi:hypothetical protein